MKQYKLLAGLLLVMCLAMLPAVAGAQSRTLLYVPFDNRPVSEEYVVDTFRSAGYEVLTPPAELVATRTQSVISEGIWQWLFDHCRQADAIVVSADALVYGGLVASRTHHFTPEVLQQRLDQFKKIKIVNPTVQVYVFSTIMRSPKMSAGGVEPPYYEQYGSSIFQYTALEYKSEVLGLSNKEKWLWAEAKAAVPAEYLQDWLERRAKNFRINAGLIAFDKSGVIDYLLLGRDDTSPYSQSHKESRALNRLAEPLPASRYSSFPGADQLGMVLLTRAVNNLEKELPIIAVDYAPGVGEATIPSYEDQPFGKTVIEHIVAAGGIVLREPQQPDLVLAVNTPYNGITLEADWPSNTPIVERHIRCFVDTINNRLKNGKRVALADIAFANGSDNALLTELAGRNMLERFSAYSGWNTASNTLGYAIGQGLVAKRMPDTARKRLLAVRYLDEWAYQANIRNELNQEIVYPRGGNIQHLNELAPLVTSEAQRKMRFFAWRYLWLDSDSVKVSFPWNRMFEIHVNITPEH